MDKIKKVRDSNIELLRLCLIFFVIILHYNGSTGNILSLTKNANFSVKYLVRICEVFCLCSVNTFLIISGYFLSSKTKVNIRKVIDLFIVVIIFTFAAYILKIVFGISSVKIKSFLGCFIPSNYYVYLYSAVFLLSPFLNLVIKLEKKTLNVFILIILTLFSIYPTILNFISNYIPQISSEGRSFISLNGNGGGYTFVNFVLLYYIGAFIKINDFSLSFVKSIFLYFITSIMIFIGTFINETHAYDYYNVLIIAQAVFLFLMFKRLHLKNKVINFIAKSVWGMFIIHFTVLEIILKFVDIESICNNSIIIFLISSITIIILTFIISLVLDIFLHLITKPIDLLINKFPFANTIIQIESEEEVKE